MNNILIEPEQIEIDGTKYDLKLTVRALYEIQKQTGKQLTDAVRELNLQDKNVAKMTIIFLAEMTSKKIEIEKLYKIMTPERILMWNISALKTVNKGMILDKSEEDDEADYIIEEQKEHGVFDLAERMFTLGHILGYRDNEIWDMTPRTIMALHRDYTKYSSGDKPRIQAADVL